MKKILLIIFFLVLIVFFVLGCKFLNVESGSMRPAIKTGSIVVVKQINKYNVGDIITFENDNKLITHRINSVENGLFVTKGDDNDRPDKHMVSKEEIVGKVIFSVPFFGYVFNFFKTKFGLSLIIAGGLIIMFSEVRKLCCIKKQ